MYKKSILFLNIGLFMVAFIFAVETFSPSGRQLIQRALAAVTNITGEGTVNYLARYVGAQGTLSNVIGESGIYDDGGGVINGKVGIGTSTPAAKLDVTGGYIRAADNGTNVAPTTGKGLELVSVGNQSYLISYDRTATLAMPLNIIASQYNLMWGSLHGNVNGAVRIDSGTGYVDVGAQNAGWAHLITDRPAFYFNTGVVVDTGNIGSYNITDLSLRTGSNTRIFARAADGFVGVGTTTPRTQLEVTGGSGVRSERLSFGSSDTNGATSDYYSIHRETGAWALPFPDLVIQYHTGIKYDAYKVYGGHQFYTGYDGSGNPAGLAMQITDIVYMNVPVVLAPMAQPPTLTNGMMWMQ